MLMNKHKLKKKNLQQKQTKIVDMTIKISAYKAKHFNCENGFY